MRLIRYKNVGLLFSIIQGIKDIACMGEHKDLKAILNDSSTETEKGIMNNKPASKRNKRDINPIKGRVPRKDMVDRMEEQDSKENKDEDLSSPEEGYERPEDDSQEEESEDPEQTQGRLLPTRQCNIEQSQEGSANIHYSLYNLIDFIEDLIIQITSLMRPVIYLLWGLPSDILEEIYCFLDTHYVITGLVLLLAIYFIVTNVLVRFFLYHIVIRPIIWLPVTLKAIISFIIFTRSTSQREGLDSVLIVVTSLYFNFVREFKKLRKLSPSKCKERGDIVKITNMNVEEGESCKSHSLKEEVSSNRVATITMTETATKTILKTVIGTATKTKPCIYDKTKYNTNQKYGELDKTIPRSTGANQYQYRQTQCASSCNQDNLRQYRCKCMNK